MKFLFISTYDKGGAAVAVLRMHYALIEEGHQSVVLVKEKKTNNNTVISIKEIIPESLLGKLWVSLRYRFNKLKGKKKITDNNYCFYNLDERLNTANFKYHLDKFPFIPEVIVPSWTSDFLNSTTISSLQKLFKAKVFWWGLDMSPITGGCHYAWDCKGYTRDCADCPAISDSTYRNYPYRNLKIKKESINESKMNFIAGSGYLERQGKNSSLFSFQQEIPTVLMCIGDRVFNNRSRALARSEMELLPSQKVIFFGMTFVHEKRKGLKYFIEALRKVRQMLELENSVIRPENILILMAGNELPKSEFLEGISFKFKMIGFVHNEEALAKVYQASDLFVCSSLEDSGPMMINESVMCGTPVVSFNVGVADDLIVDGVSGFKATLYNTDEMAQGIFKILNLSSESYLKLVESTKALAMMKTDTKVVVREFLKAVNQ